MDFQCKHCGHRQTIENYNEERYYDCKQCGQITCEYEESDDS